MINTDSKLQKNTSASKVEFMNEARIRVLLQSPHVDSEIQKSLRQMVKKRRVALNHFRTEYGYSDKSVDEDGIQSGRLFAKGCSLQNMENKLQAFRAYLASGEYHDIDQVNAICMILIYLCKKVGVTCTDLEKYAAERESILKEKNLDKAGVLKMLLYEHRLISDAFFKSIHNTLYHSLVPLLQAEYPKIWKKALAARGVDKKFPNRGGRFLSEVVFTIENQITSAVDKFFTDKGWSVDVYVFDGVMVRKREGELITPELLRECEEHVFKVTSVHMKLAEKPLDCPTNPIFPLLPIPENEEDDVSNTNNSEERKELDINALAKLEGWQNFDFRRILTPTHVNTAEWFIQERHGSIIKHPSGLMFILGKDNIWRRSEKVTDTDLNIQIGKVLIQRFEQLITDATNDMQHDNVAALTELYNVFRRLIESNTYSINVAQNVERLCKMDEKCCNLFLSNPHLFAFEDKVYDLIAGEYRGITPTDYITFTCGYNAPDPDKRDPEVYEMIKEFYQSVFETEEIMEYRLKIVARSLYGRIVEEIFCILKGMGRNGKGVEMEIIKQVFGDYFYSLDKRNFTNLSLNVDTPNAQLYNVFGKRLLATSETSKDDKFRAEIFKLMSANDMITTRTLHGKPISFVCTGIINLQTNENPVFDKVEHALTCRSRMFDFCYVFDNIQADDAEGEDEDEGEPDEDISFMKRKKGNERLKTFFQTPEFRNEFLLMLFDIFRQFFVKDGKLSQMTLEVPEKVQAFTRQNLASSLTVAKWLTSKYEITSEMKDKVKRADVYAEYKTANPDETKRISKISFFKELESIGMRLSKSSGTWWYTGLKALNNSDE